MDTKTIAEQGIKPFGETAGVADAADLTWDFTGNCRDVDTSLTVAQLIKALQEFPPDLRVWAAGCDCVNRVSGCRLDYDGTVLLTIDIT